MADASSGKLSNFNVSFNYTPVNPHPATCLVQRGVDDKRWWVRFWRRHIHVATDRYTAEAVLDGETVHYPGLDGITTNAGDRTSILHTAPERAEEAPDAQA